MILDMSARILVWIDHDTRWSGSWQEQLAEQVRTLFGKDMNCQEHVGGLLKFYYRAA